MHYKCVHFRIKNFMCYRTRSSSLVTLFISPNWGCGELRLFIETFHSQMKCILKCRPTVLTYLAYLPSAETRKVDLTTPLLGIKGGVGVTIGPFDSPPPTGSHQLPINTYGLCLMPFVNSLLTHAAARRLVPSYIRALRKIEQEAH